MRFLLTAAIAALSITSAAQADEFEITEDNLDAILEWFDDVSSHNLQMMERELEKSERELAVSEAEAAIAEARVQAIRKEQLEECYAEAYSWELVERPWEYEEFCFYRDKARYEYTDPAHRNLLWDLASAAQERALGWDEY